MVNDAPTAGPGHPVAVAVARSRGEIRGVAETPVWSMSGAELLETLVGLARGRAEYDELEARVIREAEARGVFGEAGATSPAAWLAHATKMTHAEARRRVRLSERLEDHEAVREGMVAGQVLADQASAICVAVEELPADRGCGRCARRSSSVWLSTTTPRV